uniref:Uncharacterized protein n=1 Tax=Clastoptera arizonana TaxID=38151 RepID=A0A1B6E965_9HEMI
MVGSPDNPRTYVYDTGCLRIFFGVLVFFLEDVDVSLLESLLLRSPVRLKDWKTFLSVDSEDSLHLELSGLLFPEPDSLVPSLALEGSESVESSSYIHLRLSLRLMALKSRTPRIFLVGEGVCGDMLRERSSGVGIDTNKMGWLNSAIFKDSALIFNRLKIHCSDQYNYIKHNYLSLDNTLLCHNSFSLAYQL